MKLKADYDFRHAYRLTAATATGCMSRLVTDSRATAVIWSAWPPCSSDFTPLDFFRWGYVKDLVYQARINDLAHLKTRITNAINSVTPDMLGRVWQDICRATNGSHIELH